MESLATKRRPIPTTGRLATRMTAQEQAELTAALQPWLITPDFLASKKPLEVELGIGNGMALYARAVANPACNFIGSEIYLNGLRTLVTQLKKHPLPNLRIYPEDGRTLFATSPHASLRVAGDVSASPSRLARLPQASETEDARRAPALIKPASLARVLILFPDPWPKSSHHKRRIIQPEVLASITTALQTNGELWVVTDWPSYAYQSIANLFQTPGLQLAPTQLAAADCKPSARLSEREANPIGPQLLTIAPEWWQPTKYQEKAIIAGRNPWFIKAIKTI